ncbi:MAG: hypothetical protein K6E26_09445 [Clostridiales bacterium]|nr:hypothetical protein [Clostridiales bacterium]
MAKGKKPNNGKRPNNANRQVNRPANRPTERPVNRASGRPSQTSGNRPANRPVNRSSGNPASASSRPRQTANKTSATPIRKKSIFGFLKKNPNTNQKNVQRPKGQANRQNPVNTSSSVKNPSAASGISNRAVDAMDPKYSRPLFGDEQITPVAQEKEQEKAAPKKLSWWQVRKVHKKNKLIQKNKLKEAEEAAKKEQEVPESFEEMRPESVEERRKHMAKMRKRDSLRAAFNGFLCVLILIGMMIIAVLYLMDYVAAKPQYAFATQGSIEHTIGATALVVRNETIMTSSYSGELMTQSTEGSRVAKNQPLARVIPEGMESTLADLQNVERQIVDQERQLISKGKGVAAKTVFSDANEEIRPIITMIRQDAILNNLSNMTSYSSSIRVLMDKRDTKLKDIDFEDEQLTTLRASETALRAQLENRAALIEASEPGIVSYKLDGHETDITKELLLDMVDTKCDELISGSSSIITSDLQIKQNEPVLRIVQNDVQYFACHLKEAPMEEFQLQSNHVIRIPSEGISIPDCKVIRCSVTRDGLLVVFETNNSVERLLDRRTVNIEIVQTKTTGIRVPVSSLANADYDRGIATIYVNESGYARGCTVQIKDYDREYAIIAPLEKADVPSISTIVITNPSTVKEGDKVEK